MPLAGVTETVQVTAESPLIDVRQSARQTNIRAEQVELLPKGRDFTTLVTQAPGANQEAKLGGISIDGASASENRYIIDGIETTNLQTGLSGKNLIADFVEEVQVKSSGYTAEFGGATGGVINVVTKSGTNNFNGMRALQLRRAARDGTAQHAVPHPLRQTLTNSDVAEYITYPEDEATRIEPGFALGGPIRRDKRVVLRRLSAGADVDRSHRQPDTARTSAGIVRATEAQVQYITANLTSQSRRTCRARACVQQQLFASATACCRR